MKDIAFYGAGGFGREVLSLVKNLNENEPKWNILGFFDDNTQKFKKGDLVNGIPVLGNIDDLNGWKKEISVAICSGNSASRNGIFKRITNPLVSFPTLIHPSVWIGDPEYVSIGNGCIICAGVQITNNVKIGDFVLLNLQCTVGHDAIIGNFSSFMPSVNISGGVETEEGVYVGTGAKIVNSLTIGEYAIVGAGAVVAKSLPPQCTAVGVPAKPIKFNEKKQGF